VGTFDAPDSATEGRIRAAGLRLFASRGFEATGIREIARDAGVSVAALYHYVPTKEDLLVGMIRDAMQRLLGPARFIAGAGSPPEVALAELVRSHVRVHAEDSVRCTVADSELRSHTPESRREVVGLRDSYQALWEAILEDGATRGTFVLADVKLAAFALLGMCTNVARWYAPGGARSVEEIADEFVALARRMVGCDPDLRLAEPVSGADGAE
jgi:AcrR family transcriptional regulator